MLRYELGETWEDPDAENYSTLRRYSIFADCKTQESTDINSAQIDTGFSAILAKVPEGLCLFVSGFYFFLHRRAYSKICTGRHRPHNNWNTLEKEGYNGITHSTTQLLGPTRCGASRGMDTCPWGRHRIQRQAPTRVPLLALTNMERKGKKKQTSTGSSPHTKITLKPRLECKTLGKATGEDLYDLRLGHEFLDLTPRAWPTKGKRDTLNLMRSGRRKDTLPGGRQ